MIATEALRFDAQFGLTRPAYLNSRFQLVQQFDNHFVYNAGLTYRWNKYDTDFSFRYGTYFNEDLGYQLRFQRQINESYVQLFFSKTTFGKIAGFSFQVPFLQKKYLKPKRLRARTHESFGLVYNYISTSGVGRSYLLPYSIQDDLTEYFPQFLKKAVVKRIQKRQIHP